MLVKEFFNCVMERTILIPPAYLNDAVKNIFLLPAPPAATASSAPASASAASESSAARSAGGAAAAEIARLPSIADSLKRARAAAAKTTYSTSRPLAASVS
jgi:hypothetical protein